MKDLVEYEIQNLIQTYADKISSEAKILFEEGTDVKTREMRIEVWEEVIRRLKWAKKRDMD
jgi:hypothetical protein